MAGTASQQQTAAAAAAGSLAVEDKAEEGTDHTHQTQLAFGQTASVVAHCLRCPAEHVHATQLLLIVDCSQHHAMVGFFGEGLHNST